MVWGRNVYAYALPPNPIRPPQAALPHPEIAVRERYLEGVCNESSHLLAGHGVGDAMMGCGCVVDVDVSRTTNRGLEL